MKTWTLIYLPTGRIVQVAGVRKEVKARTELGAKMAFGRQSYVNWDLHMVVEVIHDAPLR